MVFFILIGAAVFSLVFRGYGGDELVASLFENAPNGAFGSLVLTMVIIFLLGFILDFIEITFVVVPIVGPVLLAMGYDPVWLGVSDRCQSPDLFPHPAIWLCAFLPPRRRS